MPTSTRTRTVAAAAAAAVAAAAAADAAAAAATSSPARLEPVGAEDHLLGGSPASGSSKSADLHTLEEIWTRELRLGCYLEVFHVPGIAIIQQGADTLSRGMCPGFDFRRVHQELGPAKAREVAKSVIEAWERDPSSEGGFSSTLESVKSK
jgi:hypothetical protein